MPRDEPRPTPGASLRSSPATQTTYLRVNANFPDSL